MEASAWAAIGVGFSIVITGLTLAYKVGGLVGQLRSQGEILKLQGESLKAQGNILLEQTNALTRVAVQVEGLCQRQDRVDKYLNGNLTREAS